MDKLNNCINQGTKWHQAAYPVCRLVLVALTSSVSCIFLAVKIVLVDSSESDISQHYSNFLVITYITNNSVIFILEFKSKTNNKPQALPSLVSSDCKINMAQLQSKVSSFSKSYQSIALSKHFSLSGINR